MRLKGMGLRLNEEPQPVHPLSWLVWKSNVQPLQRQTAPISASPSVNAQAVPPIEKWASYAIQKARSPRIAPLINQYALAATLIIWTPIQSCQDDFLTIYILAYYLLNASTSCYSIVFYNTKKSLSLPIEAFYMAAPSSFTLSGLTTFGADRVVFTQQLFGNIARHINIMVKFHRVADP